MIILFKLFGFIRIDFQTLLSFFIGLFFGAVIASLFYGLLVVLSLRDKKYQVNVESNSLTEEKAKEMIIEAKHDFKNKELRGNDTKIKHFTNIIKDLSYGIASSFYPNSKYPYAELSIDETIELFSYIHVRLEQMFDKKVLKLFKKLKISTIIEASLNTKNVVDSKAFKAAKEVSDKAKIVKSIINVINPFNYIKRFTVNLGINAALNAILTSTIGIVGEEAYKIYSKKVLNLESNIDTGNDEILDELENELTNIKNAENKDNNPSNKSDAKVRFMEKNNVILENKNYKYENILNKDIKFMTKETS